MQRRGLFTLIWSDHQAAPVGSGSASLEYVGP